MRMEIRTFVLAEYFLHSQDGTQAAFIDLKSPFDVANGEILEQLAEFGTKGLTGTEPAAPNQAHGGAESGPRRRRIRPTAAPNQAQGNPAAPNQAQGNPAAPNQAQGNPAAPNQAQGNPAAPNQAQGNPAAPNQAQGNPAAPNQAQGNPAVPNQAQGNPAAPNQAQGNPAAPNQAHRSRGWRLPGVMGWAEARPDPLH
ncbi:circumsporozoite protein-like [Procambarus clarkii]|uniref:circumsporozoite protein-like n=1 Tax=Procambarus clarkii TaxID=6728 RepID=UPI003742F915